jgi:hypothetical protein
MLASALLDGAGVVPLLSKATFTLSAPAVYQRTGCGAVGWVRFTLYRQGERISADTIRVKIRGTTTPVAGAIPRSA